MEIKRDRENEDDGTGLGPAAVSPATHMYKTTRLHKLT